MGTLVTFKKELDADWQDAKQKKEKAMASGSTQDHDQRKVAEGALAATRRVVTKLCWNTRDEIDSPGYCEKLAYNKHDESITYSVYAYAAGADIRFTGFQQMCGLCLLLRERVKA